MPPPRKLDISSLYKLFHYEHETGKLFWKERTINQCSSEHAMKSFNNKKAGKEAGGIRTNGHGNSYLHLKLNGVTHLVHRLCWAIYHGEQPDYIDHINGNSVDNRIVNLRNTTIKENNRNMRLFKTNTSGVCGVGRKEGRWEAHISVDNNSINLGVYDSKAEAVAARNAANILEKFHVNHGRT